MRKTYENVKEWRKSTKLRLIEAFGGVCAICGYNKSMEVFDLHHLDPQTKDFAFQSKCRSWKKIVVEARKCILLCANCHREVHAGDVDIPKNVRRFDESFTEYKIGKYYDNCPICGEIKPKSQITCSVKCGGKHRGKVDWEKYNLLEMYNKVGSYNGIARIIGNITAASVKKRMKKERIL